MPQGSGSAAFGISRDGNTVVGQSEFGNFARAFKWTLAGGMQNLGVLSLGFTSVANGTNTDGTTVVGFGDPHAFRWTAASGMVSLGAYQNGPNSVAKGVSDNGQVVVGQSTTSSGAVVAFRWTQSTGLVDLGTLSANPYASASGVDGSGNVVVGWGLTGTGQHAFRWTQSTGMVDLGLGFANGVSRDGSTVVGGNGTAFRWTQQGGVQNLGGDQANATNEDGTVVVGKSNNRAFAWNPAGGMVDLNEFLPTQGVDLTGWVLTTATGVSADGRSICGSGTFNGSPRAWMVKNVKLATGQWTQWAGNGHWYRVIYVPQGISWKEADVIARQQGGHLATLTTSAENDFAFSLADDPRYFVTEPNSGYILGPWIGLVQAPGAQEPAGGWGWVTGETLSYTRWFAGQPDNNNGNEHFGCYIQRPETQGPYWNDEYDGTRPRSFPQLTSLIVESPYPPATWVQRNGGHWYKAVSSPAGIRWTDAQAQAAMEGGYLATPTSAAENDYVYSLLFSDRFRKPDSGNVSYISGWLGLWQPENAAEPAGGWLWSSLEENTYRNWTSGEPNNFLDIEDFTNYRYPIGGSQTTWNDFPNTGYPDEVVPSYVIERDSPPIIGNIAVTSVPTTMTLTRGSISGGLLPSLFNLDQSSLELKKGIVVNVSEAPINTTIGITSPWTSALAANLNLTLRASSSSIRMTTEVYDWLDQSYVTVDQRTTPTSESTVTLSLSDPTRFIKSETREMRVRLRFAPNGPVNQSDWRIQLNWVKLDVTQ